MIAREKLALSLDGVEEEGIFSLRLREDYEVEDIRLTILFEIPFTFYSAD